MQFLKKGLCALTFGMFCNEPLLKKGDKAPDFKLLDQNGAAVSLHNLLAKKKKIALVFYPRDNTTTCTKQLKKLNQNTSLLNAKIS
ncbi:redoxin domain-containing protein [bacterium]|nr:MAG: redoxin domain-containing protein [bacterium]